MLPLTKKFYLYLSIYTSIFSSFSNQWGRASVDLGEPEAQVGDNEWKLFSSFRPFPSVSVLCDALNAWWFWGVILSSSISRQSVLQEVHGCVWTSGDSERRLPVGQRGSYYLSRTVFHNSARSNTTLKAITIRTEQSFGYWPWSYREKENGPSTHQWLLLFQILENKPVFCQIY